MTRRHPPIAAVPLIKAVSAARNFLRREAAGGILLMAAAAAAVLIANSPLADSYFEALHAELGGLSSLHWINDGLMALFFLLVGLEIKREMLDGHLTRPEDRTLPMIAAVWGMAVPALIYLAVVGGDPRGVRGWAVPSATDIAFALGVLALLGRAVPASLKLFLTTVAIIDDMGAVAIIAIFYTNAVNLPALALAAGALALLAALNRAGVRALPPYLLIGVGLWAAVLASGVHATVAGVLLAMTIPLDRDDAVSPLHRLEHRLHPWVAFGIVPLFGFANAGVSLVGVTPARLLAPVPLGIALGLFLGKQLGIFAGLRLAVALGIGRRPARASWAQVYGVALLCGIGFTMSLFIGGLAFADPELGDEMKLGVLAGSLLSAVAGAIWLLFAPPLARTDIVSTQQDR